MIYKKKTKRLKIKLLEDIKPIDFEIHAAKLGNKLKTKRRKAHNIQTIESSIFILFFLILMIMNATVAILANMKNNCCCKLMLFHLPKWLNQKNRNQHTAHIFNRI